MRRSFSLLLVFSVLVTQTFTFSRYSFRTSYVRKDSCKADDIRINFTHGKRSSIHGRSGGDTSNIDANTTDCALPVTLREEDIDEKFTKGQGSGGQKINKSSNRVVLVHKPTGVTVACQDARDLSTNRKWAREMLLEKLDLHINKERSRIGRQRELKRKRKKNASRKAKKKHNKEFLEENTDALREEQMNDTDDAPLSEDEVEIIRRRLQGR